MTSKILVTGGNGQLATCFSELRSNNSNIIFTTSSELDIANTSELKDIFGKHRFDWCINCAAYTNVDQAELEPEKAFLVNELGAKNLATACKLHGTTLIHISTDYVFDGFKNGPYKEEDLTNPINQYGKSKLQGEKHIQDILNKFFILRTSWLYSEHGNNFLKTMLKLGKEKEQLNVVDDQIGSPTYAKDLAGVISHIIENNLSDYGVYHYSNYGVLSWYDFAKAIFEIAEIKISLNNIKTQEFPRPAKRPQFSILDKTKINRTLGVNIPDWKDSLKVAIKNLKDG